MKSKDRKLELASVDDLFSSQESRNEAQLERVQALPLSEMRPFKNHPFKVKDDDAMRQTVDSVKLYGVLVPTLARPYPEGGYEIVSGHRRHRASELAGVETMPVIIRDMDDDTAAIIMVDSNLQRENILPSERAFAYKMKLDAMKRQVGRPTKENGGQVVHHLKARDIMAQETGESGRQIQRFIRLTELIPQLLDMVDERKVAFNPAVELSYLKPSEQSILIDVMEAEQTTPSLSQAQRLKQFSAKGNCTFEAVSAIMSEEKKPEQAKISFPSDTISKYFPKSYTPERMQETILKLLEGWHKKRTQQNER